MPRTRSTGAAHFERDKAFASSRYPGAAPTDITLSPATVANGAAVGTLVGTLSTTDADTTGTQVDQATYAITGGTDAAKFAIASHQGTWVIRTAVTPLGGAGTKNINVKATDMYGKTYTKTPLAITVT